MADNKGRGSIFLKILIVVLAIVLIAVITIPAQLWEEETFELNTARANMTSIYEAERFYFRMNNSYTAEPGELLTVVRQDSTLQQQQEVVNNTNVLAALIDGYTSVPFVKSIRAISENIFRIEEDLEVNKRNFRVYEDIKNETDDLKMHLASLNSSDQNINYVIAHSYIDSLVQLRRDMSDYSLQSCASKAKVYVDSLQSVIDKIDVDGFNQEWTPVSERVATLVRNINKTDLVNQTSVSDRIKDFNIEINKSFETINNNMAQDFAKTSELSQEINDKYQAFLGNFLITSKPALYRLADSDSMVLHLTEENFYCPVSGSQLKILFSEDSSSVRIESPVLLTELRDKINPVAEEVKNLNAITAFNTYADTLKSIMEKAYTIRRALRKNTDIFIKYKEMEEIAGRYNDISVFSAKNDLNKLVEKTPVSESYGELKSLSETSLTGIRIFEQAYEENFFGNLDSLHKDFTVSMAEFDELLLKVRRLPKSIVLFEQDVELFNQLLADIKTQNDPNLASIEQQLGEIYLFASEGSSESRYGVFNKKIVNFGFIDRGLKSWEEE